MSENERFFKTTLSSIVILDKILTLLLFLKLMKDKNFVFTTQNKTWILQ